ncbi:MAG TPA: hypothetical protein VFF79_03000 [Conexibacter sp.]|jgi:hypothetical protein|nr:hypothetical protein [Conexibacter sp.]
MPTADDAERHRSLYDVLDSVPPDGVARAETSLTATKETLDNDQEDLSDDDVIHLRS